MDPLFASFVLDTLPDNNILQLAESIKLEHPGEKLGIVFLDMYGVSLNLDMFDVVHHIKRKSGCFCFTESEHRGRVRELIYRSSKIYIKTNSHSFLLTVAKLCQQRSIPVCEVI